MKNRIVITIARQYGSGGREIGKQLAVQLGIPFYDKELIRLAAKESGIHEDLVAEADEKPSSSWGAAALGTITFSPAFSGTYEFPINNKLFVVQSNIIKKIAEEGSCVIVGRCADYILADDPNAVHVFIHAQEEYRRGRISKLYGKTEAEAKISMSKIDHKRANYYNYYTDRKWGLASNYDLSVNSTILETSGVVSVILKFAQLKLKDDFI